MGELHQRAQKRARQTQQDYIKNEEPELMDPRGVTVRECLASDNHPKPLPIVVGIDTTGSMLYVPHKLCTGDLPRFLNRITEMGSAGNGSPQLCFCGSADTGDKYPFQFGQFEGDNRMDDWLTRIQIGGGGGSAYMHEAYTLPLYALARKTRCDIWDQGGKGFAFLVGDEMCPQVLSCDDVRRIFGDDVRRDIRTADLIAEVRKKWHLSFCYVHTGSYGDDGARKIWPFWQELLGPDAYRLDGEATGLPELMSAIMGIKNGILKPEDVPADLRELGCEPRIVAAVAASLGVDAGRQGDVAAVGGRRRPVRL